MAISFLENNLNNSGSKDLEGYLNNEGIFKYLDEKQIKNPLTFWDLAKVN